MKIAFFDTHKFEMELFKTEAAKLGHEIHFFDSRLHSKSSQLAQGFPVVCCFVNDRLDRATLTDVKKGGTNLVALRCAGFNQVDLAAAQELGIRVVRVPQYSPHAVAEHAVSLVLALNRKIHKSYARVREGNFTLDGLLGFDLFGKTVGVVGTGRIGAVFAKIMLGFGCRVLAYDLEESEELRAIGVEYCGLDRLYRESKVISLHIPLQPSTQHFIGEAALKKMQRGTLLINTGRGALIDTAALIASLKSGHLGGAGLDVYEEEEGVFFEDLSGKVLQDDVLARLLTFPNVLLTSHQGFFTEEALQAIAQTTLSSVEEFSRGAALSNEVKAD